MQNKASRVGGWDVKTKMPAMTVVIMEQTMMMVFAMMLTIACSLDEVVDRTLDAFDAKNGDEPRQPQWAKQN